MADTTAQDIRVYEREEAVRLILVVNDASGVAKIDILFRNDSNSSAPNVQRTVELPGDIDAEVLIEIEPGELRPGNYVCEYIALYDSEHNRSLLVNPGIEFRVEGDEEEVRGPELRDWSFA
jgi:hypothetical protein